MPIQITDQERKLLDLVAKGEAVQGADPYSSLWPSTSDPMIPQYTLSQIDQYQTDRINAGYDSSAIGRYQFIRGTLRETVSSAGLAPTTRFSPDVQDYLIITRLKKTRSLDQWKSGSLSDKDFQLKLAMEFASVPVPYTVQGANRVVNLGESYYAGDRLNAAGHNGEVFSYNLADIRNGGAGNVTEVDIEQGSAAYAPTGTSPRVQAELSAGGGQRVVGGSASGRPLVNSTLPTTSNPYIYKTINPLDNRYDFRTGEKVRDLLINGVNPVSNGGLTPNNGRPPSGDIGGAGFTPDAVTAAMSGRTAQIGDIITQNNIVQTPAGAKSVVQQYRVVDTPAGPQATRITTAGNINQPVAGGRGNINPTAPKVQTVVTPPRTFIKPTKAQ